MHSAVTAGQPTKGNNAHILLDPRAHHRFRRSNNGIPSLSRAASRPIAALPQLSRRISPSVDIYMYVCMYINRGEAAAAGALCPAKWPLGGIGSRVRGCGGLAQASHQKRNEACTRLGDIRDIYIYIIPKSGAGCGGSGPDRVVPVRWSRQCLCKSTRHLISSRVQSTGPGRGEWSLLRGLSEGTERGREVDRGGCRLGLSRHEDRDERLDFASFRKGEVLKCEV